MTLCAAWIRTVGKTSELIVASDSRLSGGIRWDGCPKIMVFSRSDFVICFAGNTIDAYPFMIQVHYAIENYFKASSGALDVTELSGHIVRIFTGMRRQVSLESDDPDVKFILAGYSWRRKAFRIYTMVFCNGKFRVRRESKFVFIGDEVPIAKKKLKRLLLSRGKLTSTRTASKSIESAEAKPVKTKFLKLLKRRAYQVQRSTGQKHRLAKDHVEKVFRATQRNKRLILPLDYEPFEVLRDIIKEEVSPFIGGPPQLLKIYEHMNCIPYGIYWPDVSSNQITLFGRQLLDYEKTRYIVMDPNTLTTYELKGKLTARRHTSLAK